MIVLKYNSDENIRNIFVPDHLFKSALSLFYLDQYDESLEILGSIFNTRKSSAKKCVYSVFDALMLYGWNLVMLRDFKHLGLWKNMVISDFPASLEDPEYNIILLWEKSMLGLHQQVVDQCKDYLHEIETLPIKSIPKLTFIKSYAGAKLGAMEDAIADAETSYALFNTLGDQFGRARAANFIGVLNFDCSNFREALRWFGRAQKYYQECRLVSKQSMVMLNVGITKYKVGDYSAAFLALNNSLEIGLDGNWTHRQCFANIALGNVYRLTRDFEQARKHIHTAYNQAQELGFRREESLSLEFLGDVYRDEGRPDQARRFYKRALAIALDIAPEGDIVMEVHRRVGECLTLEGDPAAASEHLARALKMARAQGDRFEEGVTLRVMAETNVALGDVQGAVKTAGESVALLGEIGAKHELAISLLRRGELRLMALGELGGNNTIPARAIELDEAWEDATRALDLLLGVDVPYWTERGRNLAARISHHKAVLEKERQAAHRTAADSRGLYHAPDVIIHTSGVMRDLVQICDMFAGSDDPVLISGETGTGKELIARRLHTRSARKDRPLVTVNVAAITPSMFEREFFGHVKGSFSGADRDGEGFAASAHGGTLFLDEIGELPRDMQPKLLRLIQDGTYQAIGDPRVRRADIRLVAATNADLESMVDKGLFRSDLYFRLKVLELNLPPVRERREDIVPLLRHFLGLAAGRPADPAEFFNYAALSRLLDSDWPGNVREIAMVARRAVMEMKVKGKVQTGAAPDRIMIPAGQRLKAERARIVLALEECGGNRIEAAHKLNMGRSTLYRRMEKLGIPTRKR